jgi:Glycosyl transferase family 2
MIHWLIRKISRLFRNIKNDIRHCVLSVYYRLKAKFILPKRRAKKKGRPLEIEVITIMYNEAILAPLFVRHYAPWADRLTVFHDESTDATRYELETTAAECGAPLTIVPIKFPEGYDNLLKIEFINQAVRKSSADFVVCVDADEFVHPWPFDSTDPRRELEKEVANVVRCRMFQVYRHLNEADIDPQKPPLFQRRHGAPNAFEKCYDKPCIVRPDSGIQFVVGCHHVTLPYAESRAVWRGTHWAMADNFCLQRYLRDRRDRFSKQNRQLGLSVHIVNETEERLRAQLKAHERDPELF